MTPEHVRELNVPVVLTQRGVAVRTPSHTSRVVAEGCSSGSRTAMTPTPCSSARARGGEHAFGSRRGALRGAEARARSRRRARLLVALGVATTTMCRLPVPSRSPASVATRRCSASSFAASRARSISAIRTTTLSRADESAALEGRVIAPGSASARMLGAAIARSTENTALSIALARRAHADRLRIGDARGALRAAQFLVTLLTESGQHDDARAVAGDALQLAEAIGDGSAEGYLRWVLGALADRSADPRAAAEHYQRALAAYRDDGAPIPERLIDAVRAAELADDTGVDPLAESRVRLSLIPPR